MAPTHAGEQQGARAGCDFPSHPRDLLPFSPQCSNLQKLLHLAQELLHTEETYVKRLHLLDQVRKCTQLKAHLGPLPESQQVGTEFQGKVLHPLAPGGHYSWNMNDFDTKTLTNSSLV